MLESELGGKLFERSGMSLTAIGNRVLPFVDSGDAYVGGSAGVRP